MTWVVTQAILFALIILLPLESQFDMPSWVRVITLAASAVGVFVLLRAIYDLRRSLAVTPVPVKKGELQTRGIYAWIRHPMYLAVWLILGGGVLRSGSYSKIILFVMLVVFFIFKTMYEEDLLKKKYPGYEKYMERVGAFLPKFL